MKTPFPGMDPYLEHRALWPDVHNRLITALADTLTPLVAPDYYVGVESRTYVMRPDSDHFLGRPDISVVSPIDTLPRQAAAHPANDVAVMEVDLDVGEEISHYYLEIRSVRNDLLITVIELLSPVNKSDPRGRMEYLNKRAEVLLSRTSLVEIDLLRAGEPMPIQQTVTSDYRILVNRGWKRNKASLYVFNLPAAIPAFPLPLQQHEAEPLIPLNDVVHDLYSRARFDLRIDYNEPPPPPLTDKQATWVRKILAA
ncbi:MAG: DUF4058 family protein [Anaerolineales bacterium]|nr:DUF4058 family protein [Anaerolineales bacterium]